MADKKVKVKLLIGCIIAGKPEKKGSEHVVSIGLARQLEATNRGAIVEAKDKQ